VTGRDEAGRAVSVKKSANGLDLIPAHFLVHRNTFQLLMLARRIAAAL
jgi:hypothetical protein